MSLEPRKSGVDYIQDVRFAFVISTIAAIEFKFGVQFVFVIVDHRITLGGEIGWRC